MYLPLQVTAWIGTGILTIMTVVHFVVLCLYVRRRRRRESSVPYGQLEADATVQEESKTDKPVPV